jgi:ParB family chromosome partitioning protein
MASTKELEKKVTVTMVDVGTLDSGAAASVIKDIPVGDIQVKENVRTEYTGIEELADSIHRHGLLQPIMVYRDGEGAYFVKTGHRRFKAWQSLYKKEPDRFHSIRCIVSNAENTAVVQLVENVQREDLSQIDLFNALSALRDQGMTHKQIAEVMGKKESYVNNLFIGINEIEKDENLKNCLDTHAGVSIQDVVETKGVPDEQARLALLNQRAEGGLSRAGLRTEVRKAKAQQMPAPASDAPLAPPQNPSAAPIRVSIKRLPGQRSVMVGPLTMENENALISIEDDLRSFFITRGDKYILAE